jgi:T4 RnlA family RNA ligase
MNSETTESKTPVQRFVTQPFLDLEAVQREIAAGYITEQSHPSAPLRILNYSQRAQFDWRWNAETMQCRGLIVDDQWNIVSRPFQKFFSVEQLNGVVPVEPFEAYEKMDGSLGVLYFVDGQPQIASRGSFTSDQAQRASAMLATKYSDARFDAGYTYLFEIIYPENRIVVDYGDREELVLLAIIETATGKEWPLHAYDSVFPVVKQYDGFSQFDELMATQDGTREGFVVRFESGQRVKIKFDEYKRLHKLLTGVSPKAIWEVLRNGGDLSQVIERVPDEFFRWVRETENDLREAFARIEATARGEMTFGGSRKELAERFKQCRYPSVMFTMLDGRDYSDQIWRMIRPSGKVFRCDVDL